ncbi:recombinase family protein [Agrobacterium tumefaciens]|uniref:recombinase family protein n=1 Tax=Agrobacterium tumefaciens TaxID=358 RepID=UPI00101A53BD|nr:recombinase family protein [Agrobacterium tumefaciens]UXS04535.1 recombinase family protein [Agrobacterium tumefaciens]
MHDFDQRPMAYSYIRMSSKRQIKGDSLRRQLELSKKYAEDHNLHLDESSMVADKGVSAWTGANLTEGAFGQFLAAAKAGHIKPGSYLLVESLDRLSRQQVRTALLPFMELINADITIVTLADNQVYSKATVDANFTQLIISLTIMARAHEESETKSKRLRAVAKNRLENAAKGVGRFSPMHVGWVDSERVGNDRWTFKLNDHANAVRRIFALADSGLGQVTITKRLNDEGVPTFRGKGLWFPANVGRIMRDETVVGTYQPTHVVEEVRQPFGQPIKDYYPAVVSEELFWRVQRGIKVGFAKGRHKGNRIANLFSGLITCAHCGSILRLRTGTPHKYLYCDNLYRAGNCASGGGLYRYDRLEDIVFRKISELDPDQEAGGKADAQTRELLLQNIKSNEDEILKHERAYKNYMASLALVDDDDAMRREITAEMKVARTKIEQTKALVSEQKEELANIDTKRKEIASIAERMNLERLGWSTGSAEEVFDSRARVAKMIKRFLTTMTINFDDKILMVALAGGLRAYKFNYDGEIVDRYDIAPLLNRPITPVMYNDGDGSTRLITGGALKPEHFTTDISANDFDLREDRLKIIRSMSQPK